MKMTSNRPYLIRAFYDWIVDNSMTPYLLVNAEYPEVEVPQEYVTGGHIVLNISPKACRGLHMENDRIIFTARFSGIATQIFLNPAAVLAIYAKENGRGMEFGPNYDDSAVTLPPKEKSKNRGKPALKLIKNSEEEGEL